MDDIVVKLYIIALSVIESLTTSSEISLNRVIFVLLEKTERQDKLSPTIARISILLILFSFIPLYIIIIYIYFYLKNI